MAESRIHTWLVLSILVLGSYSQGTAATDNVITYWNAVTQKVVRTLGLPNQIAARTYLFVHLPQYKALQLAFQSNFSYPEAAADYAAHYILSELFPAQQSPIFDGAIALRINPLNLSPTDEAAAQGIGLEYAVKLARKRVDDGSQRWANFIPAPYGSVGQYQLTPNQTYVLYPQLAKTVPFVIKKPETFDVFGPPPRPPSAEFDLDYNISNTIGNANSPLQTLFQKETAKFWEAGANTSGIVGQLFNATLNVTGPNLSLKDTAKIFAKLAVAHYDGNIAGWYQKYKYLNWRPLTAITEGDPTHAPNPDYATVIKIPPHPEYPSTHSVNGGTFLTVVADYLGLNASNAVAPNGAFAINTEGYLLPSRFYTSLNDVAVEIGNSRVFGGVHFATSVTIGLQLGIDVSTDVLKKFEKHFGDL